MLCSNLTLPIHARIYQVDARAYGASVLASWSLSSFLLPDSARGNHFRGSLPIQQALVVLTGRRPEIPEPPLE